MGSFLYDCFASRQTLIEGQEVVIIPIVKESGYNLCELKKGDEVLKVPQEFKSNVYSNCFWNPLGIYFEGIVEDHGRQTLIDTEHNRVAFFIYLEELKKAYHCLEGDNPYHEKEFNFQKIIDKYRNIKRTFNKVVDKKYSRIKDITVDHIEELNWKECLRLWEELSEFVQKNRIFLNNYQGRPHQLQHTVCLSSAFDYISKDFKKSRFYNKVVDQMNEVLNPSENSYLKEFKPSERHKINSISICHSFPDGENTSSSYLQYQRYVFHYYNLDKLKSFKNKNNRDSFIEDMEYVFRFLEFQNRLFYLNIHFSPSIYVGQDYDNSAGNDYLEFVKEINKLNNEFIKEKYDDYE